VRLFAAISAYLVSMVLANASVGYFGPWISPINSFLLIGMDLALRDWLHVRVSSWMMGLIIIVAGLLTLALNAAPPAIAIASSVAFVCAAVADWLVFSHLKNHPWLVRSNGSNIAGAAVDSIIFPTMAFGALMPGIVALQFFAKVGGGALWSWLLRR
jgi:hypothetical protein